MGAFVYILHCADDSYYVGSARGDDLDKRFYEHQTGALGGYTSTRRPVQLVFHEHFDRITDAISAERRDQGLEPRQEGGSDPRRVGSLALARQAARWTGEDRLENH